jgi:hypothetical protein
MLAAEIARVPLTQPDAIAPMIESVLFKSDSFQTRFIDHIHRAGFGDADGFIEFESGSDQPFIWELNTVRIDFSEAVDVRLEDLLVTGANGGKIQAESFVFDATRGVATWELPPIDEDRLQINLSNNIQSVSSGRFLDGDSSQGSGSHDPFSFQIVVLASDLNKNGFVTSSDLRVYRDHFGAAIGDNNYNIFHDANANGFITSSDLIPYRKYFGNSRPNQIPPDAKDSLLPGISKIETFTIDEDSGLQTILFAANTSAGPVSGQSDLQFSISSSNAQLVDGAATSVTRIGNHYALKFSPLADQFGQTQLTIGVTDAAGSISTSFSLQVQPVNDAPRVVGTPPSVVLSTTSPSAFLDLYNHFSDVDNAALIFEILDSNGTIVTTSLNGSLLHIESSARLNASTEILVQAKDEFGLRASTNINVVLQNKFLQPSAQVVPSSTSVTVPLPDLAISPNQLTIRSSNSTLLPSSSFQLTQVAGVAELTISNSGSGYGASYVTIEHNGVPLAGFVAVIMPSPAVTTGPTDPKLQVSLTPTQSSGDSTFQTVTKTVDDRAVVWLYHRGFIDSATTLRMLEPDFRAYSRADARAMPTVSQLSARYSVAQAYWNIASEGSSYWLDEIDEVWSGYQDLTGVAAAVQNRNPRSYVRDFLKDQKSASYFTSLSIAISELDPTSEPDLFSELVDSMNHQIATFARAQYSAYSGDDVQSAVLATEFVVDSSIALASAWLALGNESENGNTTRSRTNAAQQTRKAIQSQLGSLNSFARDSGLSDVGEALYKRNVGQSAKEVKTFVKLNASYYEIGAEYVAQPDLIERLASAGKVISEVAGAVLETAGSIAEHAETIENIATLVADITSLVFPSDNYQDTYKFSDDKPRVISSGDRPDRVETGDGPDDITTAGGDDFVDAGGGDNRVSTGKENDTIRDGDGNSFLSAGKDDDTIYPAGGSDVIQPGLGYDTIIYETNNIGNDLIVDTGGGGRLKFNLAAKKDIVLSKDGTDLKVTVTNPDGEPAGSVKFVDYFTSDVLDWVIETIDGIIDLFTAVRGISANDAFELAMRVYDDNVAMYQPLISPSLHHKATIDLNSTVGLRAEIFHINGDSRNLVVSIRGTEAEQIQDILTDALLGIPQSIALAVKLHEGGWLDDVLAVHLTGHSLGGMVAQWVGLEIAALTSAKFVNLATFNTMEMSGFINTVLPFHLPLNILTGYSHIHTTHYINNGDPLSRVGMFAGNGLGSTSHRLFEWNAQPPEGANPIARALHYHGPMKDRSNWQTNIEIDTKVFEPLSKADYEKRMVFKPSDLKSIILGLVESSGNGGNRLRTLNAYDYFNVDGLTADKAEIDQYSAEYRNRVVNGSVAPQPFLRKFDFGPVGSIVESGYTGVTPNDRHDGTANGIGFGWESTANLLAQDRGRADDMRRDFISTTDNTFVVNTQVPGTCQARMALSNFISRFIQMSYRVVRDAFSVRFLASSFSCIGLVEASRREVQIDQGDCRLYTAQLPLALRGSNVQAELFSRSDGLLASWPTHIGMR